MSISTFRLLLIVHFLCIIATSSLSSLTVGEIDRLVEETLDRWQIPGLALAIVQDGKELVVKGYGERERGSGKLVDAQTLFPINSLTKAMTALSVELQVQEGKIDLDLPLRTYFPHFQSTDPEVTQSLSLRDLLCHRSGLPGNLQQGSRLFWDAQRAFPELLERLAFIDLAFPFRSRFNYDNLGYTIASEVVAAVSGMTWADFCRQKIFDPLHMNRTTTSYSAYLTDGNAALPHFFQITLPIPGHNWEKDSMVGASGVISCAHDMALWLRYCLSHKFLESYKPQIRINSRDFLYEAELPLFPILAHGQPQLHYGFGWTLYKLEDNIVYRHTGSCPGMQSVLAIVPDKEVGIAILSNQSKHPAISGLMNELLDSFLDRPSVDWQSLAWAAFAASQENEARNLEKLNTAKRQNILPTLPLSEYVGVYTHLGYGSVAITKKGNELAINFLFGDDEGILEHWDGDRFIVKSGPIAYPEPVFFHFLISSKGEVSAIEVEGMALFKRDLSLKPIP